MDYQQIVDYLNAAQVPHREQDGKIQVLDFSQIPWGLRGLFNAQGFIINAPASSQGYLFSGDLHLNSHAIIGTLISEQLTIDGGLL